MNLIFRRNSNYLSTEISFISLFCKIISFDRNRYILTDNLYLRIPLAQAKSLYKIQRSTIWSAFFGEMKRARNDFYIFSFFHGISCVCVCVCQKTLSHDEWMKEIGSEAWERFIVALLPIDSMCDEFLHWIISRLLQVKDTHGINVEMPTRPFYCATQSIYLSLCIHTQTQSIFKGLTGGFELGGVLYTLSIERLYVGNFLLPASPVRSSVCSFFCRLLSLSRFFISFAMVFCDLLKDHSISLMPTVQWY